MSDDVTPATRFEWYNSVLDPAYWHKMTDGMAANHDAEKTEYPVDRQGGHLATPSPDAPANLVSSLCTDGKHRPALDIDLPFTDTPAVLETLRTHFTNYSWRFVESASGLIHAYGWGPGYCDLGSYMLDVTATALCSDAYIEHSRHRGQTLLRVPGVPKNPAINREPDTATA